MKLKFLGSLVFVLSFFGANAQRASFSLGPEINFPSGNASNISSIGIGLYVKGELALADRFAITAAASLNTFYGKKVIASTRATNLSYLPVRAGLKYYPAEGFYIEGQAGASFPVKNGSKTAFIWAPGLGTFFNIKGGHRLDVGLRYESQSGSIPYAALIGNQNSFSYIGLRAGYVF